MAENVPGNPLVENGQGHLLRFLPELGASERERLTAQLAAIDWEELARLIRSYVIARPAVDIPADLQPATYFPLTPADGAQRALYGRAEARGAELIRQGQVAALTVAGGQGTRLGFDGPKGTFPITPVSRKPPFRYFAEALLRAGEKYGAAIPWCIMTSPGNDADTRAFFATHGHFGMDPGQVHFFTQGTMPAIGLDGRLLLESPSSLALSPDGHGGTLLALRKSGMLEALQARGIRHLSYFQVDNPLVSVVSPLFIGLHDLEGAEMSCRMLAKTGPFEKLGNFCRSGDRLEVIEYSDLPAELAERREPDGCLTFLAGSPAIHVIALDFIARLTVGGRLRLPWHRADKKVPCLDAEGRPVKPDSPNAVKLETFIFDALPMARKAVILEAGRADEFGPFKNPTGVDSVESCRAMLVDRDARRLEAAGIHVPRHADGTVDGLIELSPRRFLDQADVVAAAASLPQIRPGEETYIP
jgi:UDP-N-acetylglucosamine/UDP-N-acetylgalactosamine diphosphorylase